MNKVEAALAATPSEDSDEIAADGDDDEVGDLPGQVVLDAIQTGDPAAVTRALKTAFKALSR